jgi:uroporphyrinogen III methyltransferase / synthase
LSLAGKKILITRPIEQSETMTRLLRERSAEAVYFPTIHIVPPASWDDCDEAIDNYRTYDALIFTSVNAVRYFFDRAFERGVSPGLTLRPKVYVVGAKTADAVAGYGITASRFPGVTTVLMLAAALCSTPVLGKRFLFPKGNLAASDITWALRAEGATVDEVIVYETAAGRGDGTADASPTAAVLDTTEVCAKLRSGEIAAVTFFSPSSVENFLTTVPCDAVESAVLAAIGPTTAEALRTHSLPVQIMPAQPTSEELVAALDSYFQNTIS